MSDDEDDDGHDPTDMLPSRSKRRSADTLLKEILTCQIDDVPTDKKLQSKDIMRICKNIERSIFDKRKCCMWRGHVTNMNNLNKGRYVNFYFRRKKVALHRLLYVNFVGELNDDEYLKFNCDNKGICCNIHHLKKFKYQKIPEKQELAKKRSGTSRKSKESSVLVISSSMKDGDWHKYGHKLTLRLD
jgi:hypothetical protein